MEKITEICDRVFRIIQRPRLGVILPTVNIYVLAGRDGLIFDAGYGTRKSVTSFIQNIKKIEKIMADRHAPCRIARILPSHSHPDHFSGLVPLKNRLGVNVLLTSKMMHNLSSEENYYRLNMNWDLPSKKWRQHGAGIAHKHLFGVSFIREPDEIVDEEKQISVNGETWRILESPGHCDDHISLYNEKQGILLAGDNVLQSITTWLGPPRSDIHAYCHTLNTYLELPKLEVIHAAHGGPVLNPKVRIRELLDHRDERMHAVLDIIRKSGRKGVSIRNIVNGIYTGMESFKRPIAGGWVALTLKELETDRLIEKNISGSKVRYFLL